MVEAKILDATDPAAVALAAATIRSGGIVAFPTETVYGLGADARNPVAVARVFEAKSRPRIDPLIVHVSDRREAKAYGYFSGKLVSRLMKEFWPGPLTLVVRRKSTVPDIVTAGLETVAVRMPAHRVALALLTSAETAIAAPSANPFGYVSPTEARHVQEEMSGRVDIILDGGRCPVGVESTILSLVGSKPQILRLGGTPVENIERVIGPVETRTEAEDRPQSPGRLARHYATRTPLEILPSGEREFVLLPGENAGLLTLTAREECRGFSTVEVLSPTGDLREAAANLFAALRRLDSMGLDRILAFPLPEVGLGAAIMDRLRRCAAHDNSG